LPLVGVVQEGGQRAWRNSPQIYASLQRGRGTMAFVDNSTSGSVASDKKRQAVDDVWRNWSRGGKSEISGPVKGQFGGSVNGPRFFGAGASKSTVNRANLIGLPKFCPHL
tara:strand:- start:5099 stop:5428 length:330 start_codon:yes stop_codon:yes gene_type:complete